MSIRNVIESTTSTQLTKKEMIDLIHESFPDAEVGSHGKIATVIVTELTDGTKMQTICFGKFLKV